MVRQIFFGLAALSAAATISASVATARPATVTPAAADLVAARQGAMITAAAALSAAGQAGANANQPLKRAGFPVSGLAKFAQGMPAYFAPLTAKVAGTEAKPEIWTNGADFAARVAQFRTATAALAAAVQADDRAAFTTALDGTKAACKACHDAYRIEK